MGIFDILKRHKKEESGFDASADVGPRSTIGDYGSSDGGPSFNGFNQQSNQPPFGGFNQPPVQPGFGGGLSSTDIQLMLTKLDLINQRLEVLDRRLQVIEKIAKDNQ